MPGGRALALALAAASALLVAAGSVFFVLYTNAGVPDRFGWQFTVPFGIGVLAFAASGVAIVWASAANRIAWLLLLVGLVGSVVFAFQRAGLYFAFVRGDPIGGMLMSASGPLLLPNSAVVAILIPLLFPDGRLPSARWRPVLWGFIVLTVVSVVGSVAAERVILLDVPNAYRLENAAAGAAFPVSIDLYIVVTCAAVASLIHRYRTTDPTTRLQIRWVTYAASVFGLAGTGLIVFGLSDGVTPDPTMTAIFSASFSLLPVAVTVAILRYRLYEIDVLIHRTLVYGLTSASIAVAFFVAIGVLQLALRPFTTGSELAVAGSTVASFALIRPVRSRIQSSVDRRFYRGRYDAERTVDRLIRELSDQVDLSAVRGSLLAIVAEALEPAHASVWLRDSGR